MDGEGKSTGMIAQLNKEYIFTKPAKVIPRLLSYFLYEGRPATTKGRWFNPVTFMSLRHAANARHIPACEQPIFITGTGRSGSTVLGLVLSMHSDVGFLNEPKALWYTANPADDLIGSYSSATAKYRMNADDAESSVSTIVKSLYSSFLKRSHSKRIVDKFPEMIFRIEYLNHIFKNPKYIFLYRNPWDTISSTALWSESHTDPDKHEDWWGVNNRKWDLLLKQVVIHDPHLSKIQETVAALTKQTDKAAVEWIVTMNHGLKMMQKFPDLILPVKYENLAGDAEKSLNAICRFTSLHVTDDVINFGKKILNPSTNNRPVQIHPSLAKAIDELSEKLGYSAQLPSMSVTE